MCASLRSPIICSVLVQSYPCPALRTHHPSGAPTPAGQINDAMAENMELQASMEGANVQCQALEGQCAGLAAGAALRQGGGAAVQGDAVNWWCGGGQVVQWL